MNNQKREREVVRKTRARRIPNLGYYIIVTDTKETEQNYINGLKRSIPKEYQDRLVIKVIKTSTCNLVSDALNEFTNNAQYGEPWILFDRDQVKNFDDIIREAEIHSINVAWTNPCLEEWFYAYFGSMPNTQDSVKCCEAFSAIFRRKTGQEYKKSDEKIYEKLNMYGDEKLAINIASIKYRSNISAGHVKPSQMNPCTTLHLLISEIKNKI